MCILLAQEVLGDLDDVLSAQAVVLQQFSSGAGAAELIVHADTLDGSGQLFAQQGADSLTQTADDRVLFAGDDLAALAGSFQNQLLISHLRCACYS